MVSISFVVVGFAASLVAEMLNVREAVQLYEYYP
jgi:hypothetical protein